MEDLEDEREGLVTGLDISRSDIIARVNALKLFAFVAATFAIVLLVALLVIVIHDADTSHSTSSTSASSTGTLGLSKLECSLIRSRPDGPTGDFYFYREMHEQTEGQFADVVHVMGALTVHKATHKQKSFAVHILQANIFDNSDIPKSLKIYNPMRKAHACPPTPERETGSLGNINTDKDGVAIYDEFNELIGIDDILGKTLVVRDRADPCDEFKNDDEMARPLAWCTILNSH